MRDKRNWDKHTSAEDAKRNILSSLFRHGNFHGPKDSGAIGTGVYTKSALAYIAFPDYDFKAPQGAAFAVAKIVRDLENDELIWRDYDTGHMLTSKGVQWCRDNVPVEASKP